MKNIWLERLKQKLDETFLSLFAKSKHPGYRKNKFQKIHLNYNLVNNLLLILTQVKSAAAPRWLADLEKDDINLLQGISGIL